MNRRYVYKVHYQYFGCDFILPARGRYFTTYVTATSAQGAAVEAVKKGGGAAKCRAHYAQALYPAINIRG